MPGVREGDQVKRARTLLFRVVLFGVLGAVTTALVAAVLVLSPQLIAPPKWLLLSAQTWQSHEVWTLYGFDTPGQRLIVAAPSPVSLTLDGPTPYRATPSWSAFRGDGPSFERLENAGPFGGHEAAAGWPLLAFHGADVSIKDPGAFTRVPVKGVLVRIPRGTQPELLIPLTPMWPGFAANSAIYGLAWFSLAFGVGRLKRWRRRRRGLCPFCRYDLSGVDSDTCPECGRKA